MRSFHNQQGRFHETASPAITQGIDSAATRSIQQSRFPCEGGCVAKNEDRHMDRRGFLECMAWVGTGAVWTMSSGVLKGMPLGQGAKMPVAHGGGKGDLRFVQISDSHIGFDKPANTDVTATLRAAIAKIKTAPKQPSFILHTGDLTHLSKPAEFDTLQQVLSELP